MSHADADELAHKANLYNLVLAPSGRAFAHLLEAFSERCDATFTMSSVLGITAPPPEISLILITGIEDADTHWDAGSPNPLGPLRAKVSELLDLGKTVILVSRYPRLRYPKVPGSSLLEDARLFHPCLRTSVPTDHPLHALPSWDPALDEVEFLTDLVSELGTTLAARLDQILYESPHSPQDALSELSSDELDGLHFSGLVTPESGQHKWSIPRGIWPLKDAVANCLASTVSPPRDLGLAFELLWKIERRVRSAMRYQAVRVYGTGWKVSLMHPEYDAKVPDRAAMSYSRIPPIKNLRDPLEWLTLPELLKLRVDKQSLGTLGLNKSYWPRLSHDVVPIRNQLSHMRFLKPGDLTKLRQWDAILAQHLCA